MKQGEELTAVKSNGERITVIYSHPMEFGNHKVFSMSDKRYMSMVTLRKPMGDFECRPINKVH